MKFLLLCMASILVGTCSSIPVHLRPVNRRMVEVYFRPRDDLAAFHAQWRGRALEVDDHPVTIIEEEDLEPLIADEEIESQDELVEPGLTRSRRSTQPRGNQGNGDRGSVDVDVSRTRDGGTRVDASGRGTVWESRDRNGRVDVHGHYGRDYGGRYGTGRPNYGGGIRYTHRF